MGLPTVRLVCRVASFGAFLLIASTHATQAQTIEEAWASAYRNNPSLEAERARLRALDEKVAQSFSHWRPSVTGQASIGKTYQYIPGDGSGQPNTWFAKGGDNSQIQLTQPLFRGFRTIEETREADKQVKAGHAHLQAFEQQLLLDSGKAFLDTLRDETLVDINRDEETVLRKKREETSVRARVGDLTQTDVRQAETRLARAQVARLQAENTLIDDRATYERLVGEEPGVLHVPALKASNHTMKDVMHRSETINPSVIDAEFTYEAANNDVNLNIGSLLPEIDLVGTQAHSYGQSVVYPGRQDNTQVMLQMTFPLYDGGESYSKIREARQTATQRRMELEETRHKSVEQARAAWQALLTAEAAIKADEAEIDSAGKALEGVKTEARVGSRTTIDVLNAEQELLDAKTDITNAHHDRDYALLQIRSAIGELTADAMQLPVNVYDPDEHYSDNTWKPIGFGDDDDYVVGERNKMAALDKKDEERALAPEPEAAPATDPVPEAAPQPPVEAVPEAAPTTEAP